MDSTTATRRTTLALRDYNPLDPPIVPFCRLRGYRGDFTRCYW